MTRIAGPRAPAVFAARRRTLATIATLVLAGCGGGDDPAPPPAGTPGAPVQRADGHRAELTDADRLRALVRERAAALEAGDVAAYAATAIGAQRARDRRAARRAARLRLRDVVFDAQVLEDRGDVATMRVREAYSFAGVRSSYRSTHRATAVRAAAGWRIRKVRGARGLAPWEVGAFAEERSRHFVVLTPAEVPIGELIATLEAGYGRMRALLPHGELRRRYLVVVARDDAQARALTTQIRGVETLTAIADAAIREAGPARAVTDVVSERLLVVWPRFAALDADGRGRVVTHELTHAALAGATSGRTPAWLVEGVALYVSGDRRAAPAAADLRRLSRPNSISRLTGRAQADAYAVSSAAAYAIAERYGRRRLFALYDAFNDPELEGAPGRRLVEEALRRELGTTTSALAAGLG